MAQLIGPHGPYGAEGPNSYCRAPQGPLLGLFCVGQKYQGRSPCILLAQAEGLRGAFLAQAKGAGGPVYKGSAWGRRPLWPSEALI